MPMAAPRVVLPQILCVPVLTVDTELVSVESHGILRIILGAPQGGKGCLRAADSVRAGAQLIPACLCLFICSLAVSTSPHVSLTPTEQLPSNTLLAVVSSGAPAASRAD